MGTCVHKQRESKPPSNNKQLQSAVVPPPPNEKYTIEIKSSAPYSVKFNHSPLSNCPFLHQKFTNSANKPEQINLTFMILGIQVNQDHDIVTIRFINENQVSIYLIIGGEMGMSSTGLIIDVTSPKFVQKITKTESSPQQGNSFSVATPKIEGENIMVIIEPNLKAPQSMYQTNLFKCNPQNKTYAKKQSLLQWSSLSFNLQDIYGTQTEFRCDKVQDCSVCLSSPANVIVTPCRHMCMCNLCSKKYQKIERRCPICRAEFHAFIQYT